MSSFKSNENIQKKGGGPDRSVSEYQSSSVTLTELAMKVRKTYCKFEFQQRSHTMTDYIIKLGCTMVYIIFIFYFCIDFNIDCEYSLEPPH